MANALVVRSVVVIHFFIIMMITTNISSSSLTASVASSQEKLVLKLIHRDSQLSPFYNSNATIWELRKRAIARSFKRVAYLSKSRLSTFPHHVTRTDNNTEDVIGIGLHPTTSTHGGTNNLFLANISVGQPPVLQTLAVDTGSNVTWISCAPCPDCTGTQTVQLFDPNRSSTYTRLPCWRDCRHYGGDWCNWQLEDNCTFTARYGDGSNVAGVLVTEQVVFTTVTGPTYPVVIDGIGCAHSMTYTGPDGGSGVLGLGHRSFVNQIGSKFSYCLGDASDPNYEFSRLIIGDGANLLGDKLTGSVKAGQFLVGMTGISVGEDLLHIDPSVFVPDHGDRNGGVILDTGSTLTYLIKDAYNLLYDKVESVTSHLLNPVLDYDSELLCYAGRVDREVSDFPYVTFHFEGGVVLVLGPRSFFLQVEPTVVCMAVAAGSERLSVIGVMAQQDYNIGFDNQNANVYIQSIDCSIYFDA